MTADDLKPLHVALVCEHDRDPGRDGEGSQEQTLEQDRVVDIGPGGGTPSCRATAVGRRRRGGAQQRLRSMPDIPGPLNVHASEVERRREVPRLDR